MPSPSDYEKNAVLRQYQRYPNDPSWCIFQRSSGCSHYAHLATFHTHGCVPYSSSDPIRNSFQIHRVSRKNASWRKESFCTGFTVTQLDAWETNFVHRCSCYYNGFLSCTADFGAIFFLLESSTKCTIYYIQVIAFLNFIFFFNIVSS